MSYISSITDKIIAEAEKKEFFKGIKLVASYPKSVKPTLLKSAVAAFSCRKINAEAVSLGSCAGAGDIELSVNIYVPYINNEITGDEIAMQLCDVIFSLFNITAVNVASSYADGETECIVTKTEFHLNGEIKLGGADSE